jgi:hypothetical protein
MTGFYFTLLAVLLVGFGARDQATVAALTQRQGARPGVLLVAIAVSVASAALAAWGATLVAPMLPAKARLILAAMALGLAGAEALVLAPRCKPEEPTLSLGALAIVLFAQQLTDGVRFLVFAIAAATSAPIAAGMAGAVGGGVLLAAGWVAPGFLGHPRMRVIRRAIGGVILLIAVFLALRTFGRI